MSQHKIECWWLEKADAPELVKCDLFVDLASKVITIKRLFKDDFVIKEEEIAELRTGLWTDTWINAKPTLGELIAKADISGNEFYYRSIVYKPTQRVLPSKTVDLIVTDREAVESLYNLLSEMIRQNEKSQVDFMKQNIDDTKVQIVDDLFSRYSEGKELLSIEKLKKFLFDEQRIMKTITKCEELAAGCDKQNEFLTVKGFRQFFNKHFGLFNSEHQDPVNQPMTNYFIASSHNSYLYGGQWFGNSSCEMYRNILLDGCRCIEIDVFYRDGRLTVLHGGSGTPKIELEDVLLTINEYAFAKSKYPLILSIENHLHKVEHEDAMAQMLKTILKDKLYTAQISENVSKFAQLDSMIGFIFIKCKRAKPKIDLIKKKIEILMKPIKKVFFRDTMPDQQIDEEEKVEENESKTMTERDNNGDLGYEDSDNDDNFSYAGKEKYDKEEYVQVEYVEEDENEETEEGKKKDVKDANSDSSSNRIASDGNRLSAKKEPEQEQDKKRKFLELLNYFEAKHFDDFDKIDEFKFHHMISISQKKSKNFWMDEEDRSKYQDFTKKHMARVYPTPVRAHDPFAASPNYRPIGHWNAGAQMVSLNYQTVMSEMAINWALFALNNGCGYVLKPRYLLNKRVQLVSKNLRIQILGGSFGDLFKGKEAINLTVTTRVYAAEDDNDIRLDYWNNEKETQENNERTNPKWNDFMCYKLSNPELSFVQFSLKNFGKFVGHYMISYKAMQNGYRWFDLEDEKYLPQSFARIYVHVDKEFTTVGLNK